MHQKAINAFLFRGRDPLFRRRVNTSRGSPIEHYRNVEKEKGRLHNVIQGLFIDRHCIRMVMDVFYFEPRDPSSPERKKEREEEKGQETGNGGGIKQERAEASRGCEGEKVERNEEARGDGLAGANHLVCIHLRRILFLTSLGLCLFSIRRTRPRVIHLGENRREAG